jgi:glyoxylase-like metal-dependent hydrolase (beta-lactamase superfamily II)
MPVRLFSTIRGRAGGGLPVQAIRRCGSDQPDQEGNHPKPVRYVVNTHFHDGHSQGNSAYKNPGSKVDFIASQATAESMATEVPLRLKETLEIDIPKSVEKVQGFYGKATTEAEKEFWKEQLRQYAAFQAEMKLSPSNSPL